MHLHDLQLVRLPILPVHAPSARRTKVVRAVPGHAPVEGVEYDEASWSCACAAAARLPEVRVALDVVPLVRGEVGEDIPRAVGPEGGER